MKKILLACAAATLMLASCGKQEPSLFFNPSSVNLKVGETKAVEWGTEGEGIDVMKIKYVKGNEDVAYLDQYKKQIVATGAGDTKVGIAYFETDTSTSPKYTALCSVHVTE